MKWNRSLHQWHKSKDKNWYKVWQASVNWFVSDIQRDSDIDTLLSLYDSDIDNLLSFNIAVLYSERLWFLLKVS